MPASAKAGRRAVALALAIAGLTAACASAPAAGEIARDRAIAIARAQVTWQPFDVSAARTSSNGRRVWKVTLKGRLPGQPPMLFETAIVEVDAVTGAIVSVGKT
jgi:hypothetical protein